MALVAASTFVGDEISSEINAERSEALRVAFPLGKMGGHDDNIDYDGDCDSNRQIATVDCSQRPHRCCPLANKVGSACKTGHGMPTYITSQKCSFSWVFGPPSNTHRHADTCIPSNTQIIYGTSVTMGRVLCCALHAMRPNNLHTFLSIAVRS